jgi:peptidoglycan/LPS O-acetylase OafA/YrhL
VARGSEVRENTEHSTQSRVTQTPSMGFRPDIEGMRGIAVLLVVMFHCGVPGFGGGFIGVDVFFALSGYLITGLILTEIARTGTLGFRNFYARRARRLLPASGLMVLGTLLLSVLVYSPLEVARFAKWASYTSLYISNFAFMRDASNYFASDVATNPFLHTWSLAVEEQFYLVWPALIVTALWVLKSRRRFATLLILLSSISLVLCVWLTHHRQPWAFFSLPVRAWEFGFGGLACMVSARELRMHPLWMKAFGWAGLLAVLAGGYFYSSQTRFPGIAALLPVAGTLATLVAGTAGISSALSVLLGNRILQFFGRLSYSWYLWHWPILLMTSVRFPGVTWHGKLLAAAVALLLAQITFLVLEKPIRLSSFLIARPALSLGLVLLTAVSGITGALIVQSRAQRILAAGEQAKFWAASNDARPLFDGHCVVRAAGEKVVLCDFGDLQSGTSVVLFGDSHAEHWFPALEMIANEKHWHLLTVIKASCPPARVQVYNVTLKREDVECSLWRESALQRIVQLRPSLVILSEKDGLVANRARPAVPGNHSVSPQKWGEGLRSTVSYLDSHGVRTLVISDVPREGFDVPICLSRAAAHSWANQDCVLPREAALNEDARQAESAAIRGIGAARLVDFADKLCTDQLCQSVIDGEVVFRDSNHLTSNFARKLAPFLEREMESALRDPNGSSQPVQVSP